MSRENGAELLIWWHKAYNPAHHIGLWVHQQGETAYFSFSPVSLVGTSQMTMREMRIGRDAFIMNSLEDEKLIWGFRHRWSELKTSISDTQKEMLPANLSIGHLGDKLLFEVANLFPEEIKLTLRKAGEPDRIKLTGLDLDKMIERIKFFNSEKGKQTWVPMAGHAFRPKNAHNCASIILDILYAGKLKKFVNSPHDILTVLGFCAGFIFSAMIGDFNLIAGLMYGLSAGLVGRFLGGFYEGFVGIDYYLSVRSHLMKDTIWTIMGFKLFTGVFCAVTGLFTYGPVFPAFIALPKNIEALVK